MKKHHGFTLIELMIVMFIISILVVPLMNVLLANIEERRLNTTIAEISDLFQSAQTFAADNAGAWPDEATGCANAVSTLQLPAQGYLVGFNTTSVFGAVYSTACPVLGLAPRRFNVSVDVGDVEVARKITGVLPATTMVGSVITTSVPLPAQIPALELLLPRDGSRPMTGDLDMGNNDVLNANDVEINALSQNGVKAKLSTGINFAGIVKANELSVKYRKPSCPSGATPTPIVVPAGNSSTNVANQAEANPIGAQYGWAVTVGPGSAYWQFHYKMAVYRSGSWELNHRPHPNSNFLAIYMKCT